MSNERTDKEARPQRGSLPFSPMVENPGKMLGRLMGYILRTTGSILL